MAIRCNRQTMFAIRRDQRQPIATNRFEVRAARDQCDRLAPLEEPRADGSTDPACTIDDEANGAHLLEILDWSTFVVTLQCRAAKRQNVDPMLERLIRTALNGTLPAILMFIALAAGLFALIKTPREEEPQIVVPVADVLIDAPTLDAQQVERLISTPLEKLLTQIDGVEHVYSTSDDGRAMVTVRFFVGENREDSLVKLYNKIFSNQDIVPPAVTSWVVKPVEIDDVPIVVATLWSDRGGVDDYDLRRLAQEVALDLQSVADTNRIDVIGGRARELRVEIDPTAMAARNTAISDVLFALTASNVRLPGGSLQRADTQ